MNAARAPYPSALRSAALALVLLLLTPLAGRAQGLETHELLETAEALYAEAGIVFPTVSLPVSRSEVVRLLRRLQTMPESGSPGYDSIRSRAAAVAEEAAAGDQAEFLANFILRPEYYHQLDRSRFLDQVRIEDPLGLLDLGYGVPAGPYLLIRGVLQREWQFNEAAMNVREGIDGYPVVFQDNFVRKGYVYLPVGTLDLTFGRQHLTLGPDPENSLYVSSAIPFLDALKVTLQLDRLKMTSVTSTLENGRASPDVATVSKELYGFDITTIYYNIHYFEYAWNHIRLGLGSQVVLARQMNNYHLGDFFPVFSWHNADISPNNLSVVADVTVTPAANLSLFFQGGLDDVSGEEFGFADTTLPTIGAYLGGATYRLPRYGLSASTVAGYTHYLWGNFDDDEYLAKAIYRMEADGPRESMPLTSPYGPGVIWSDTRISRDWLTGPWRLGASLRYRARGRLDGASVISTPYDGSEEIEQADRLWTHDFFLTLEGSYADSYSLMLRPGVVTDQDDTRFAMEIAAELHLTTGR